MHNKGSKGTQPRGCVALNHFEGLYSVRPFCQRYFSSQGQPKE
jgi:hypothetical protein